ncbi:hypothetical protein AAVH_21994 [Aphelenchoides avenae]|nr:hypothetical protein AAVH_21994 [Aphelenchus avenae]
MDSTQVVPTTSPGVYCPLVVNGVSWTLFRGRCYHRYTAPFGIEQSSAEDIEEHYKTWFEAREECANLGAKLASVHDQATHEKLLQLIAGNESVTSQQETTWIGLQVGIPEKVALYNPKGVVGFEYETGCYWPTGMRPRLEENDPNPENAVDECSVTYDDTFRGQWEDGQRYNEAESAAFWGPDEPNDYWKKNCEDDCKKIEVDEQSRAYCERGACGKPDRRQHCAQILPADEKQIDANLPKMRQAAGKWLDYWCWMKNRGYICERPARRPDGSEDGTFIPVGMERQSYATTTFCGVRTTAVPGTCEERVRGRTDEIELEINATRIGYNAVMETMAPGEAAVGKTWSAFPTHAV